MMHKTTVEYSNGKYSTAYDVASLLDSNAFHKMLIESKKEYQLLDMLYDDGV